MARLKGNILGDLKGKIGNLSARVIRGKTFIFARPSSFRVSQTPGAIKVRTRFAATGRFSKHILRLPDLRQIWQRINRPDSILFNTIFKANYHLCDYEKPTVRNIITPGGFKLPVQTIFFNDDILQLELQPLDSAIPLTGKEVNITINCLLAFYNPYNKKNNPYTIITLSQNQSNFNFGNNYTCLFNFNSVEKKVINKYKASIIYTAVVVKSANGEIIRHSSTFSKEMLN